MIVQCDQCQSKFRLDDSKITDKGAKVRCSKCSHIFTVMKEGAVAAESSPTPAESKTPASAPPKPAAIKAEPKAERAPAVLAKAAAAAPVKPAPAPPPKPAPVEEEGPEEDEGDISWDDLEGDLDESIFGEEPGEESEEDAAEEEEGLGLDEGDFDQSVFDEMGLSEKSSGEEEASGEEEGGFDEADFDPSVFGDTEESSEGEEPSFGMEEEKTTSSFNIDSEDAFADLGGGGEAPSLDFGGGGETPSFDLGGGGETPSFDLGGGGETPSFDLGGGGETPSFDLGGGGEEAPSFDTDGGGEEAPSFDTAASGAEEPGFGDVALDGGAGGGIEMAEAPASATEATPSRRGGEEEVPSAEKGPVASAKGASKKGVPAYALLLILLLSILGGAFYLLSTGKNFVLGPFDLRQTIEALKAKIGKKAPVDTGKIEIRGLNAYYLQTEKAGLAFVVEGKAVNSYTKPRSFIKVRGNLFDNKGAVIMKQEAYCGNVFSKEETASFTMSKVAEEMAYKSGKGLMNNNIAPGSEIPFMIVFYNTPDSLAQFDVEAAGSEGTLSN